MWLSLEVAGNEVDSGFISDTAAKFGIFFKPPTGYGGRQTSLFFITNLHLVKPYTW
jgi:hypothetical protein